MNYTRYIELDINAMSNSTVVAVKQGDENTRYINIKLLKDGEQFVLDSGTIALFRCEKPDGKAIVDRAVIENDGTLTVELSAQAIAVEGHAIADICLINSGEALSTITFIINVIYSPDVSNRAASSDEFKVLNDLIAKAGETIEGIPGGYYLPNVSINGELSWTPSKSDMPRVESRNISGPRGADGHDGQDGTSVSILNITESSTPGGTSVVTFSDGSSLQIHNGTNGIDGTNGESVSIVDVQESSLAGGTSIVTFSNGVVLHIKNGLNGAAGRNGIDGSDGSSVTITNMTESTVDGGSNVIEFSDGSILTIKNGHSGSSGLPIVVTDIAESEASGGVNTITFSDGNVLNIRNGINGTNGANGNDGSSVEVSDVTESSQPGGVNIVTFSDGKSVSIKNGINGAAGSKGDTGAVFKPNVSANGVLSWTNDGGLSNPLSFDLVSAVLAALPNGDEVSY